MTKHVPSGSPDLTQMNINKLKELFPEAITDGGKIDFETLQTILGEEIDDEGERYSFTWPGKRESILGSQLPSKGTLRPNIDKSKDFDHTENLYIEGDNLEVLKLLQKSYNSKVKVIYIDPPYNTGNDFIYKDNFREGVKNYLEQTGQVDSNGNLLSTNSESNGRFHTNWLNMMYPRLRLARNLLTMDGVILISISDKEAANLKHICDEIFGEKNFIENFVWVISGNTDNQDPIIRNHEYILCYAKNAKKVAINNVIDPNIPENSKVRRNFVQNSIIKNGSKNPPSLIKLPKGFPARIESKVFKKTDNLEQVIKEINRVGYISRSITKKFKLHYPLHSENLIIENFKLQNDIDVYSGWANNKKLEEFIDNSCKPILNEDGSEIEFYLTSTGTIEYMKKGRESQHILTVLHNMGTTEKEKYELENMGLSFDFPKPKKLIEYLLSIFSNSSDIILDFFSGSATTSQALINLNIEDKNSRKFICVQMSEKIEESDNEYSSHISTITDIGSERIRRAGDKIIDEHPELADTLDIGFKYLQLDKSNIREWNPDFEDLENDKVDLFEDVFIEGRSELDIVYEIMLKNGLELTLPVTTFEVEGKTVYDIAHGSQFICLANGIDMDVAEAIIAKRNAYDPQLISGVVFKDKGFLGNDAMKLNVIQALVDADFAEEAIQTI